MQHPVSARRVCPVVQCDGSLESWTGTVRIDSNEFVRDCSTVKVVVQHNGLATLAALLSCSTPSILSLFLSRRSLRLLVDRLV